MNVHLRRLGAFQPFICAASTGFRHARQDGGRVAGPGAREIS